MYLEFLVGVRSGGYTLYTVVAGLYVLLLYVQFLKMLCPNSANHQAPPTISFLFCLARLVCSQLFPKTKNTLKTISYFKACGIKTIVANGIYASSSVFDPSILSWITSFFVLTIVTQIAATTLIAVRIYAASQLLQLSEEVEAEMGYHYRNDVVDDSPEKGMLGCQCRKKYERTQREKYLATLWLVVESGFIYSSAAIVQLVTYLLQMNAGVILEFMLSQLSVSVFFSFCFCFCFCFFFPIYTFFSHPHSFSR